MRWPSFDPKRAVFYSGLCHGRHHAPGAARRVGDHRRVDRHPAAPANRHAALHQPQQFLRPTQASQLVGVQGMQFHLTGADGVDQLLLLIRRGMPQITVDRPKDFGIPLEPRPRRIVGGLAAQLQRLVEDLPVLALHGGLNVRVADVHVRVREQIDHPFAHRLCGVLRSRRRDDVPQRSEGKTAEHGNQPHWRHGDCPLEEDCSCRIMHSIVAAFRPPSRIPRPRP